MARPKALEFLQKRTTKVIFPGGDFATNFIIASANVEIRQTETEWPVKFKFKMSCFAGSIFRFTFIHNLFVTLGTSCGIIIILCELFFMFECCRIPIYSYVR